MMKSYNFPKLVDQTRMKLPPYCDVHDSVSFGRNVTIEVTETLIIGAGSKIADDAIIKGRNIIIGKNFVMNHHAEIGGGSCFEKLSSLEIGDDCHLGSYSIINTSRKVIIGSEVGMGRFTNLYTHGAWLNPLEGFPCSFGEIVIGNKVWIPGATILPATHIGNNIVISQGAKVSGIVPDGSHITKNGDLLQTKYPTELSIDEKQEVIKEIMDSLPNEPNSSWSVKFPKIFVESTGSSIIDLEDMTYTSKDGSHPGRVINHLRRHGIRIKSRTKQ